MHGCWVKLLLGEISTCIADWLKQIALCSVHGPHPICSGSGWNKEKEEGWILLTARAGTSIFRAVGASISQAFRLGLEFTLLALGFGGLQTPAASWGLQLGEGRSLDCSASITLHQSYNKPLYTAICEPWTFQMFKLVLGKADEPEIKLPTFTGS